MGWCHQETPPTIISCFVDGCNLWVVLILTCSMAMVLGALLKALMAMYPSVAAVFTSLWNRLMDWE